MCHFDGKKLPQAASKNNDAASLKILKPVQIVQAVQPLGSIHHGDQPVPVVPIVQPLRSVQTFQANAGSKRSKVPVVPIGEDVRRQQFSLNAGEKLAGSFQIGRITTFARRGIA